MTLLSTALKEKEFDVRMIQRNLSKGNLLQEEVDKNQKKIEDSQDNVEFLNLDELMDTVEGKSGLR